MGRVTKAIVITATAMIAAGMILSVIGFAFGGLNSVSFGSRGFRVYFEDERGFPGALRDVSQGLYERFTSIDVDVDAYFIELREDDDYSVVIRNEYVRETLAFDIKDDVLTVRDTARSRERGIRRFLSVDWLRIFNGYDEDDIPTIVITYPANARLSNVDIEAAAGKVEVDGLEAASLSVDCSAGSLEIDETSVQDLSVTMSAGECRIDDVRAESAVFDMDAGSFSAKGFDCGELTGDFRMGNVDVSGRLRGNVDISANMGSVSLKTDLPEWDYRVDLNVALGAVSVGGRSVSGLNAGMTQGSGRPDSENYTLRIRADMGNVDIAFAD
ncbi:MAG: DUF4097 family beta strand repeat-containing protein [Clostridiales Family XIII bacterium]|nr:DUF4097 family beta strand repeat-containing protein [Clostridiales Family XIII bacterium]